MGAAPTTGGAASPGSGSASVLGLGLSDLRLVWALGLIFGPIAQIS